MTSPELIRDLDALAEWVTFGLASLLPLLTAAAALLLPRRMRLIWKAAIAVGTHVISGPVAFVLLMEWARAFSSTGRPGPGVGIIALPMVYLWLLTLAASITLLMGLAFFAALGKRSP